MYTTKQPQRAISRQIVKRIKRCGKSSECKTLQLTQSSVYINDTYIAKEDVKIHDRAKGGIDHAEQLSWNNTRNKLANYFRNNEISEVKITFDVDSLICEECQKWFETTVYTELYNLSKKYNKNFSLYVSVNQQTARIYGEGFTEWPETIGMLKSTTRLKELKSYLYSWGGISPDDETFFYYDESAQKQNATYTGKLLNEIPHGFECSELDLLILENEVNIRKSHELWRKFQEREAMNDGNYKMKNK